ncbi:hypothetical protein GCM10027341_20020 [Spirosoma knui]
MKKVVSIGLSALLLYHTLAYVLVLVGTWWQAENDLSERLLVYRSVDSLVEFEIPLTGQADALALTRTTNEGFVYKGHYYNVVSLEIRANKLYIAGLETERPSFWQDDLLSFLNNHVAGTTDTGKKANQFLKFLLKEYSPNARAIFQFLPPLWRADVRIPDAPALLLQRALPIYSPPPEV